MDQGLQALIVDILIFLSFEYLMLIQVDLSILDLYSHLLMTPYHTFISFSLLHPS